MAKKNKFKYIKSRIVPAKADREKQEKFLKETLEPLLEQSKNGERIVYFADGVHVIYSGYSDYGWCTERLLVPSFYGRKRVNTLGFLNAYDNSVVTVTNNSYLNSDSVALGLEKLRLMNGDKLVSAIMDNAKYQKCEKVTTRAKELNIDLVYLPSYSPNLNLIERLWKFLRKKFLGNKYLETFEIFMANMDKFIVEAHINYKEELETLLAHNFEVLGN